ncbi:Ferritin/ribonucleotide reductase [Pseudovirgaria hyperparasitica]|uniref:Ferritin/ribonucleotide reductase n=1 Tax=Pseudovirgaria hyperparasitica TaxID=470096 RepID=A0A6A6VV80_9PEZI|nr:Ferritin/ribonucleotide reductase [Pseudovirgaria hyperparasitica]KAF2754472.1 Ferritin/ribonucleotide reductase [Pseudovirgaria hyperparasitica]
MKTAFAIIAAAALTAASPVKRAAITDADILNYALTLEHLEDTFYREGLQKYTEADFAAAGFDSTFYTNLKEVSYDEATHVSFLTSALSAAGASPVAACTYNFGYDSVETFVATAGVLEGVGVSAYLGAAASIVDKTYLTAAGSVLTVESRHSSYLRAAQDQSPFPQAFDAPLTFNEVYTLAAPFIVSCPESNAPLPVKAFPMLALSSTDALKTGSTVEFTASGYSVTGDVPLYAAWIAVTGPTFAPVTVGSDGKTFSTTVPEGFHGQSYLVLTTCSDKVTDDTTTAGPLLVEITGTQGSP